MTPVRTICTWVCCGQTTTHHSKHKTKSILTSSLKDVLLFFSWLVLTNLLCFLLQCLSWWSKGKLSFLYGNDCDTGMSPVSLVMIGNWVCLCVYLLMLYRVYLGLWWRCRPISLSARTRHVFTSRIFSGESSTVSFQNLLLLFHLPCDYISVYYACVDRFNLTCKVNSFYSTDFMLLTHQDCQHCVQHQNGSLNKFTLVTPTVTVVLVLKCCFFQFVQNKALSGHFIRYTLLILGWTPSCLQN